MKVQLIRSGNTINVVNESGTMVGQFNYESHIENLVPFNEFLLFDDLMSTLGF